jgi:hypothetical protein
LFGAIRNNRVARWVAIAIALNLLVLMGQFIAQWRSSKSVTLWVPATDVHPYLNSDTGKVVEYKVTNVDVEQITVWTQKPKLEELYGALGLNIALFAWVLRLVLVKSKEWAGCTDEYG